MKKTFILISIFMIMLISCSGKKSTVNAATNKTVGLPNPVQESTAEDIVKETRHDKKMEHGKIKFILLDKVGEAAIYQDVTPEEMLTVLERV